MDPTASRPQSMLTTLQQYDYATFITFAAIGYDYVLTFSKEIEYIWVSRCLAFVKHQ
ncbi:hypothetical protein OG21DRAFT_1492134 [Imleria badia]|nr:hypothetical protein OG21DRAFT_1492134 [Imleria badia]